MLEFAANANYPPARRQLGICYDVGDDVEIDRVYAAQLWRRAAELNDPMAKWLHGCQLLYGAQGMAADRERGRRLIEEAAAENIEFAVEFLNNHQ